MFRAPAPELGPDLDLRPGEPTRSTLPRWIATCRQCGAAAPDLAALGAAAREVVASPAYRALAGRTNRRALPFLRWAALQEAAGEGAAEAWLQAAWTADDAGDEAAATGWRREAAARWGAPRGESLLRLVDVLRRAGDLAAAAKLAESEMGDPSSVQILAFQRARIAAGDRGRHLLSSALQPPASRPHVAHATRPGGLWTRLFGSRER